MRDQTTTDLATIREFPHRFTWGRVLHVHDIGDSASVVYTLVEYEPRSIGNNPPESSPQFHIYVDGKSTSQSATSFDRALIAAISLRYLDVNTARYMAQAAVKLLEVK